MDDWQLFKKKNFTHDFKNFLKPLPKKIKYFVIAIIFGANDLKICLEEIDKNKKDNPHKSTYFMKLAISHLRELAKNFPCDEVILNEIKEMNRDVQIEFEEIRGYLEPYDKNSLTYKVLKEIRDGVFHYPNHKELDENKQLESVIDNLKCLEVVMKSDNSSVLGQFYLFGSKISCELLNQPLNKDVTNILAQVTALMFSFADALLHHYHLQYEYKINLLKRMKKTNII
jgi:hypothetical protein